VLVQYSIVSLPCQDLFPVSFWCFLPNCVKKKLPEDSSGQAA